MSSELGTRCLAMVDVTDKIDVDLFFDSTIVGKICEAFEHQGTWFGTFHSCMNQDGTHPGRRVKEFIEFCIDWHRRLEAGEKYHDNEFEEFNDILLSNRW